MALSRKIEIGCAILVALLGIFLYLDIILSDMAVGNISNAPFKFSSKHLILFLILSLPSIIVAIGACVHVLWRKGWGLGLLTLGCLVNNLLMIIYRVGLAYAFINDFWGTQAIFAQFLLVIITLIAACWGRTPSNNSFNPSPR
jgi:hypothetical protein